MTPTDDAALRFACPKCLAKLTAPKNMAGKQSRCPYCQMGLEVPWRSRIHDPNAGYSLHEGPDEPSAGAPEYLSISCPVCQTRMRPTVDEIGAKIRCPDCGTETVVERPRELPSKKRPKAPADFGEYALITEIDRTDGAVPAAGQNYVAVVCSTCHTRMLATEDQVGQTLLCPDCGTASVVPPMPPPRRKPDPMEGDDGGYSLAAVGERPVPEPLPPVDDEPDEVEASERSRPRRRLPVPAHPFLDGTFDFALAPGMRACTFGLIVWAAGFSLASLCAARAGSVREEGSWFVCAALMAISGLLALMWLTFASACALAIVRDTSNGCDKVENWPGPIFTDWLLDPFYIFGSLCAGALPGAVAAWLLTGAGVSAEWLAAVSPFFFLPIVLLSMLENGSPLGVVSWPVLRTLRVAQGRWLAFYAASGVLLAAVVMVTWVAWFFGPVVAAIVNTLILPVAWFAYFRLLGRLALCLADRTMREGTEEET